VLRDPQQWRVEAVVASGGGSGIAAPRTLGHGATGLAAQRLRSSLQQPRGRGGRLPRLKPKDEALCRGGTLQGDGRAHRRHSPLKPPAASRDRGGSLDGGLSGGDWADFLGGSVGLVALSMRTPASLAASMASWQGSGLLGMVSERIALLSEAMPAEKVDEQSKTNECVIFQQNLLT